MAKNLMNYPTAIQPTLKKMEVGESVDFPLSRINSVCAIAYSMHLSTGRKYRTQRIHELGYVRVVRTL